MEQNTFGALQINYFQLTRFPKLNRFPSIYYLTTFFLFQVLTQSPPGLSGTLLNSEHHPESSVTIILRSILPALWKAICPELSSYHFHPVLPNSCTRRDMDAGMPSFPLPAPEDASVPPLYSPPTDGLLKSTTCKGSSSISTYSDRIASISAQEW